MFQPLSETYIPSLRPNLLVHNIMIPLPMPRQVQNLVARPLGRLLVQRLDVLYEPLPLRRVPVALVLGIVRLVGAGDQRQVRLRRDLEGRVGGAGGAEAGEDVGDGGEFVVGHFSPSSS